MSRDKKKYALCAIKGLILILFVLYFSLNLVYVSPANPLRDSLGSVLDSTIGAYFPQDWNLFAPNPRTADLALLVRPMSKSEVQNVKARGLPENGWYDLSAPLWTRFQHNRFSAYNRLGRPADQAIAHYLTESRQQQPVQLMIRLASTFCKDIGQSKADFVALMISERLGRSWLDKDTTKVRAIQTIFVGIYPLDKSVEGANLYQRGETHESLLSGLGLAE